MAEPKGSVTQVVRKLALISVNGCGPFLNRGFFIESTILWHKSHNHFLEDPGQHIFFLCLKQPLDAAIKQCLSYGWDPLCMSRIIGVLPTHTQQTSSLGGLFLKKLSNIGALVHPYPQYRLQHIVHYTLVFDIKSSNLINHNIINVRATTISRDFVLTCWRIYSESGPG